MKHLSSTLLPAVLLIFLLFNVTTLKTNPGAPPLGGVAGDPSRTTCALIGCHPGPEMSFNAGELVMNMGPSPGSMTPMAGQTYTPGQTYYMEFNPKATNGNNTVYGFQMTSLDPAANMAGSFTIVNPTQNSAQNLLGRDYIGHKDASAMNDWTFQWTAPASNVGDVTFYYTSNVANGNGASSGDHIYKGTLLLSPDAGTGVAEVKAEVEDLRIFPVPAKDFITISLQNNSGETTALANLIDANGRIVQQQRWSLQPYATQETTLPLHTGLAAGSYLISIQVGQRCSQRHLLLL